MTDTCSAAASVASSLAGKLNGLVVASRTGDGVQGVWTIACRMAVWNFVLGNLIRGKVLIFLDRVASDWSSQTARRDTLFALTRLGAELGNHVGESLFVQLAKFLLGFAAIQIHGVDGVPKECLILSDLIVKDLDGRIGRLFNDSQRLLINGVNSIGTFAF